MNVDGGNVEPQPDLRQIACDAANRLFTNPQLPGRERLTVPVTVADVVIRCQRTWHEIRTENPGLNGVDFSAAVVQFEQDSQLFSLFIEAVKPRGTSEWRWAGSSGGRIPAERRDRAGGCMLVSGSYVCVGGLGTVPVGGEIHVEMANGNVYQSREEGSGCIVFAPVTSPPHADDEVTIRYLGPDGQEIARNTMHFGDGKPPPGMRSAT